MKDSIEFEEFIIEPIFFEKEINYIISHSSNYFCRLVPGQWGFELSVLDKAIGNEPEPLLIAKISDRIIQQYD